MSGSIVDGRNPATVDMVNIPLFAGFFYIPSGAGFPKNQQYHWGMPHAGAGLIRLHILPAGKAAYLFNRTFISLRNCAKKLHLHIISPC